MDFAWSEFFTSILIVSGISGILATLMVIADATIGNYGELKIAINKKKELTVEGGQPLLTALKNKSIFIPSACGGRGSCGLCKLKVDSGGGDILSTELPWLDDKEKAEKIRLSCQLKVKQNMELTIPEELFNVKEYKTEVSSIVNLTHDIKEITLALLEPAEIEFKAGQFIQMEIPEYDLTDEPVYRAYSIASAPSMKNSIKLQIKYVPDGISTTYVNRHMKVKDKVIVNGPYGDFCLRNNNRELIFMATGSGMAPIYSILLDMAEKGVNKKTTFFFGCKEKRDLFLTEEMKDLERKMTGFKFVPSLSRPREEDNWQGETGRLNTVIKKYLSDTSEVEAYLCAGTSVIESYKNALKEMGIPENRIFYDDFG